MSTTLGNNLLTHYNTAKIVSPPTLKSNVFTTAALDNIDHNPSSTTAEGSFHGTGISLFQQPTMKNSGAERDIYLVSKIYIQPICICKNLRWLKKQAKRVFKCAKPEYSFEYYNKS